MRIDRILVLSWPRVVLPDRRMEVESEGAVPPPRFPSSRIAKKGTCNQRTTYEKTRPKRIDFHPIRHKKHDAVSQGPHPRVRPYVCSQTALLPLLPLPSCIPKGDVGVLIILNSARLDGPNLLLQCVPYHGQLLHLLLIGPAARGMIYEKAGFRPAASAISCSICTYLDRPLSTPVSRRPRRQAEQLPSLSRQRCSLLWCSSSLPPPSR